MARSEVARQSRLHGLLGYDVFLSYTRRDGRQYAHELASRLMREHDFVVFLDDNELEVGQQLAMLLRQVRRSRMLVLLATPGVRESSYVPQEVEAARRKGRRIVPIDLEKTIATDRHGTALRGLLRDEKWEPEKNALEEGPSDEIVHAIVKAAHGMRRRVQQRVLIGIIGLILVSLSVLAGFSMRERVLAERERERQKESAEVRQAQTRHQGFALTIERARDLQVGDPISTRLLLEDPTACPPELRDLTWRLVHQDCGRDLWESPVDWGRIKLVRFFDEGTLLAVGDDGTVRVFNVVSGEIESEFPLDPPGDVVAVHSGERRRLCVLHGKGELTVYESDGRVVRTIQAQAAHDEAGNASRFFRKVKGAVFLGDGNHLASIASSGVRFWDLESGFEDRARRAGVLRTGEEADWTDIIIDAAVGGRGGSEIWAGVTQDLGDGYVSSCLYRIREPDASGTPPPDAPAKPVVSEFAGSGTGEAKFIGSSQNGIVVFLTSTVDVAADSGDKNLRVHIVDTSRGNPAVRPSVSAGQGVVTAMAIGQRGDQVCLAYQGGSQAKTAAVRFYDTREGVRTQEIELVDGPIAELALDDENQRLALVMGNGRIKVIRAGRPRPIRSKFRGDWKSTRQAFHKMKGLPDGRIVHLWGEIALDPAEGGELLEAETGFPAYDDGPARGILWSAPEPVVEGDPEITEISPRETLAQLVAAPARMTPDGRWLALPGYSSIELEDLATLEGGRGIPGRKESPIRMHSRHALLIDFASNPERFALVQPVPRADKKRFRPESLAKHEEWSVVAGGLPHTGTDEILWTGTARPRALSFSPTGRWLAFADGIGPVRIWDARTGSPVQGGAGEGKSMRLAFASDESLLVLSEDAEQLVSLEVITPGRKASKRLSLGVKGASVILGVDATRVAVGAEDGTLVVVDLKREMIHAAPGPAYSFIYGLEVSRDGMTLLVTRLLETGGVRCTLADATFGHDILELSAGPVRVLGAGFLAGGDGIVMVGADRRYHVWRLDSATEPDADAAGDN